MSERSYTPYVVSDPARRQKAPLHFAIRGRGRTVCGVKITNMDSGCLSDDMDFEEVMTMTAPCQRCITSIRRNDK